MVDLQELLKQYKLSKTGDKEAISYLLSSMGEDKLLKTDSSFEIMCRILLADQADMNAIKTLFALKEVESANEPIYIEPDYIKKEKKKEEKGPMPKRQNWKPKKKQGKQNFVVLR